MSGAVVTSMKLQGILIGAVVLAVVMAVSNPPQDRYTEHMILQFADRSKETFCQSDRATQQQCQFAIAMLASQGKPLLRAFIENSTRHQNFVIFSVYTTDLPNQKLTTIAAFGNFFRL
ncbi:MAG: DUF4359 domain-containing protein [Pseudanabaenaceae cyanobacterium bins.39]|nr:DUF4359 domain-containing protein [Pseudanabaenaceae cyanobacterium bins.39]